MVRILLLVVDIKNIQKWKEVYNQMIFVLDDKNRKPAYWQLYETIKGEIIRGAFPFGRKLPSKRSMADMTGVSIITVEHAYMLLQDEGYIESRVRSGYFVIYKESDFHSTGKTGNDEMRASGEKTVLISNQETEKEVDRSIHSDDPPFSISAFSKTIRRVLLDNGDKLTERCPAFGDPGLRQEICDYLARSRAMYVRPEQVVIGAGAEYLYGLIAQFFKDSDSFAIEWPCYEKIYQVYEAEGHKIEKLTLKNEGISIEDLRNASSKILHITPFHSYPTGISADISKRKEYVKWAKENDAIIIEDNHDSELTISRKMEDSLFSLARGENVIYINTFSKTIAPSLRAGYMVLPESMVNDFSDRLGFYSCTVPMLEQLFLAEILGNGEFERHINKVRRYRRKKSI